MDKTFLVVGLLDEADSCRLDEIGNFVAKFKTREEAEEARDFLDNHYSNKCKINCYFEVREVEDTDLNEMKSDIEDEYRQCYAQ